MGNYSSSEIGFRASLDTREQTNDGEGKVRMSISMKPSDGAMPEYAGKFVKFDAKGYSFVGVYRGVNGYGGSQVLRPSIFLDDITTPNLELYQRQQWRDFPSFIRGEIINVQFVDEKFLRGIAQDFDKVKDLGTIVKEVI